jgi:large subunit ribosomal protein L22
MKTQTASTVVNLSPRKSRLVINPVRGMKLDQALLTLQNMNKGKTKKFHDLLKSAAFNLKLTEAEYSNYKVSEIVAEEAQRLYRMMPRAQGRAFRIRRRYTRVKVKLDTV